MDMPPNIETVIDNIEFRVLIEPADDGMYIARSLQTGVVAVGATVEEAEMLIKAILENDFRRAIELGSVAGQRMQARTVIVGSSADSRGGHAPGQSASAETRQGRIGSSP